MDGPFRHETPPCEKGSRVQAARNRHHGKNLPAFSNLSSVQTTMPPDVPAPACGHFTCPMKRKPFRKTLFFRQTRGFHAPAGPVPSGSLLSPSGIFRFPAVSQVPFLRKSLFVKRYRGIIKEKSPACSNCPARFDKGIFLHDFFRLSIRMSTHRQTGDICFGKPDDESDGILLRTLPVRLPTKQKAKDSEDVQGKILMPVFHLVQSHPYRFFLNRTAGWQNSFR